MYIFMICIWNFKNELLFFLLLLLFLSVLAEKVSVSILTIHCCSLRLLVLSSKWMGLRWAHQQSDHFPFVLIYILFNKNELT